MSEFLSENKEWIGAIAILVATFVVAKLVDGLLMRNFKRVTERFANEPLSNATVTRLRLVRRLIALTIFAVGIAVALIQVDVLRPAATTLLASSAVIGVAVGMASRSVIANGVAGMMISTVQPFRVGDVVEWQGQRGRVEDITLSYTLIRLPSSHRLVVPNDVIATTPLENLTITGGEVEADASVYVHPHRATEALSLLREKMELGTIQLGACDVDRIEVKVGFTAAAQREAAVRFATREQAVAILSDAGILDPLPEPN